MADCRTAHQAGIPVLFLFILTGTALYKSSANAQLRSSCLDYYDDMCYDIKWILSWGGMYFGILEQTVNYTSAKCTCTSKNGLTRLAILDSPDIRTAVSQVLTLNYSTRQFWVDAVRPSGADNYTWADGCPLGLESALWKTSADLNPTEPKAGDTHARLVDTASGFRLEGYGEEGDVYPLCQTVAPPPDDPTSVFGSSMTWVALGEAPGHVFGFSDIAAELNTASMLCSRGLQGNVTLATLDTLFDEVLQYLTNNNSVNLAGTTFWLNALGFGERGPYLWVDGPEVNSTMWASGQPGRYHDSLYLSVDTNQPVGLWSTNETTAVRRFICEAGVGFGAGCTTSTTTGATPTTEGDQSTQLDQLVHSTSTVISTDSADSAESTETASSTSTDTADSTDTASPASTNSTSPASTNSADSTSPASTNSADSTDTAPPASTTLSATTAATTTSLLQSNTCRWECGDGSLDSHTSAAPNWTSTSSPQFLEMLQETQQALQLDSASLSATRRRLTCAEDSRPTAQACGSVGSLVLAAVVGAIVVPDVGKAGRWWEERSQKKEMRRKRKSRRRGGRNGSVGGELESGCSQPLEQA